MSHKLAKLIKRQYQASKSASSKYLGRRLGDRPLLPSSIANVTTGTFAVLMLSLAMPAFLTSSTTYAEPYALSISFVDSSSNEDIASPTIELNVSPSKNGTFSKSNTSTIGVGTTSATGYTLSIAATGSNGDKLVNSSDSDTSTNYIASITDAEGVTEEAFKALPSDGSDSPYNNKWAYLPSMWDGVSNNLFRPAPTTAGHVLNTTSKANTVTNNTASDVCKRYDCDKYDITVGARVDVSQKIGTYSNTYVVYATANGTPYTIVYKDNTISMPADESSNATGSTVTISGQAPTKDGYTFLGWCTVSPTTTNGTDTCPSPATQYSAGGTWNITTGANTNNLVLYAMWQEKSFDVAFATANKTKSGGYYLMQDMTADICNNVAVGQTTMLYDSRDNEAYTIGKLKDNRCWMLDNLRLDPTALSLSALQGKTNASDNTLNYFKNGGGTQPYTSVGVTNKTTNLKNVNTPNINNTYRNTPATSFGQSSGKIGVYYNYCATAAGSFCSAAGTETVSGNISEDICPLNWRLPTGGNNSGELYLLYTSYTNLTERNNALSIVLSGFFYDSDQAPLTSMWLNSSTYNDVSGIYQVVIHPTNAFSSSYDYWRTGGHSIRCIANNS